MVLKFDCTERMEAAGRVTVESLEDHLFLLEKVRLANYISPVYHLGRSYCALQPPERASEKGNSP